MPGRKAVDAIIESLKIEQAAAGGHPMRPIHQDPTPTEILGPAPEPRLAFSNDTFIGDYRTSGALARYPKTLGFWYRLVQWLCFWRR